MEVMAMPNKETKVFLTEVDEWLVSDSKTSNGVVFTFRKDTPESVLETFISIKDKLPFKVSSDYKIAG